MIHNRTVREVQNYDRLKLMVAGLLGLLLILILALAQFRASTEPLAEGEEVLPVGEAVVEPVVEEVKKQKEAPTGAAEAVVEAPAPETDEAPQIEPVAPSFNFPGAGMELTEQALALSGSGTPGSTLRILINDALVGETEVAPDGTWTFDATLREPGDYTIRLESLAVDGAVAAQTEAVMVSLVETEAAPTPEAVAEAVVLLPPSLTLPEAEPAPGPLTLTGSGEPETQVEILLNGEAVGTTQVAADGRWSIALPTVEPGDYTVSLRGIDAEGRVYATTATEQTIRLEPEPAPLTEDGPEPAMVIAAPTITNPAPDAILPDNTLDLTGTGTPGATIEVLVRNETIGTTQVDQRGGWTFETDLPETGTYLVSVQALDAAGQVVAHADPIPLTVTTLSPPTPAEPEPAMVIAVPTITGPAPDTALPDNKLALTGTGTPSTAVNILLNDEIIDTVQVDESGRWAFETDLPEAGLYQADVQAVDETGAIAGTADPIAVSWRWPPIEAPEMVAYTSDLAESLVILAGSGTPGSTIELLSGSQIFGRTTVDQFGHWSFTAQMPQVGEYSFSAQALDYDNTIAGFYGPIHVPREPDLAPPTLSLNNVDPDHETLDDTLSLTGQGSAGARIQVLLNGAVAGETQVDEAGQWTFEAPLPMTGPYQVQALAFSGSGAAMLASPPANLTRLEPVAPPTLEITNLDADRETYAATLDLRGTGTPNATVQVTVNGHPAGQTVVDAAGEWAFTAPAEMPGDYEITATALDKYGQVAGSAEPTSAVRLPSIVKPTITAYTSEFADEIVVMAGTGSPDTPLHVLAQDQVFAETRIDQQGKWSFSATLPEPGEYAFSVVALDKYGAAAASSELIRVIREAPLVPPTLRVDNADEDAEVTTETLRLSGSATPNTEVQILLDERPVGTVTVAETGIWHFSTPPVDLGAHQIRAYALSRSGIPRFASEPATIVRVLPVVAPTLAAANTDPAGKLKADTLEIGGSGTPGSIIEILIDEEAVGRTEVDAAGTWAFETPLTELDLYRVAAQALDKRGEVSGISETLIVARIPTALPLTAALRNVDADNETTAEQVTVFGTSAPETTIEVLVDGEVIGAAAVDNVGSWALNVPLAEYADYRINARSLDPAGTVSSTSPVLRAARVRPIVAPTIVLTTVDADNETTAETLPVRGIGTPGSQLQILVNNQPVETLSVDAAGNWETEISLPDLGDYIILAQALDKQGAPIATSLTLPVTRIAPVSAPTLRLTNLDADNETTAETLRLQGDGTPGSQVEVLVNGAVIDSTWVNLSGEWMIDVPLDDPGSYQLAAQALDKTGVVAGLSATQVATRTQPIQAPTIGVINIDDYNETTDEVLEVAGRGTPGSTVEILVNGELAVEVEVDEAGSYTVELPAEQEGRYLLSAQTLDKMGEVAGRSEGLTVTRIPPIIAPTLQATNVDADNETFDNFLRLQGSGTPDAIIRVLLNDEVVGTTLVNPAGEWRLETALTELGQATIAAETLNRREEVTGRFRDPHHQPPPPHPSAKHRPGKRHPHRRHRRAGRRSDRAGDAGINHRGFG